MAIKFTNAALENTQETGTDADAIEADIAALCAGSHTRASLLELCLDGADEDRRQGWEDYVAALCDEALERLARASDEAVRVREAAFDAKLRETVRGVTPERAAELQDAASRAAAAAAVAIADYDRARASL